MRCGKQLFSRQVVTLHSQLMPSFLDLGVKGLDHFIPFPQLNGEATKLFSTRTWVQLHMSIRLRLSSIQTELEHWSVP